MFWGLGCISRLAAVATLIFTIGSVIMFGLIVASDGLSGDSIIDLPTIGELRDRATGVAPEGGDAEDTAPGTLNEVVERRDIFEEVPYPSEVSSDPEVVGTNAGMGLFFAIVFGILGTILNNLLREHEQEMMDWLDYFYIKPIFFGMRFLLNREIRRGCLGLPIMIVIFLLYGAIFTFLEPGTSIFEPEGLQLAVILGMSVAMVTMAGDVAQRQLAWVWRKTSRFGIYPANLSLAVVSTAISRFTGFTPGIMFGTPGGVDIDMNDETRFREMLMSLVTLIVVLGFGLGGFALVWFIRSQGDSELSGRTLSIAAPVAQLAIVFGMALFVIAIETAFFEMIPLSLTMGSQIFRWNPLLWGVMFGGVYFLASHTIFSPDSEYLSAFGETPVLLLTGAAIIIAAILVWFWVLFRYFDPPHIEAMKRREAYQRWVEAQQAQQNQYPPQPPQAPGM